MHKPTRLRSVALPIDWWDAVDAARGNHTVSEFLRRAVRQSLPVAVRRTLSEPRGVGKPRKER